MKVEYGTVFGYCTHTSPIASFTRTYTTQTCTSIALTPLPTTLLSLLHTQTHTRARAREHADKSVNAEHKAGDRNTTLPTHHTPWGRLKALVRTTTANNTTTMARHFPPHYHSVLFYKSLKTCGNANPRAQLSPDSST